MNADGLTSGDGFGNGTPPRVNVVAFGKLYPEHRVDLEARYPRLRQEFFFAQLEAYMVVCEPEEAAYHLGGTTWLLRTPDGVEPPLAIYFTYTPGRIVLQAVWPAD